MSLNIAENGDLHLTEQRSSLCIEAAWELEQLAYLLPTLMGGGSVDELRSGFVVRGVAARIVNLSEAICAALTDRAATTEALKRKVMVLQFEGDI